MANKLPPIPDDWHKDNRERFDAESIVFQVPDKKCPHFVTRKSMTQVNCTLCNVAWIDNGRFIIENGKIKGMK